MIADPFGEAQSKVIAPFGGIVIGRTNLPLVHQGEALFHIARFEDVKEVADDHQFGLVVDTLFRTATEGAKELKPFRPFKKKTSKRIPTRRLPSPAGAICEAALHRVSLTLRFQCGGQVILNFGAGLAFVQFTELHANTGGTIPLRAFRRNPDDAPGNRQLVFFIH